MALFVNAANPYKLFLKSHSPDFSPTRFLNSLNFQRWWDRAFPLLDLAIHGQGVNF
jgi:hypothetical protein